VNAILLIPATSYMPIAPYM